MLDLRRYYSILKAEHFSIFCMVIVTAASNYLVEIQINEWLTWGAFTYPLTFLITEINNYFYGVKRAQRVVYFGFVTAVILSFLWMNKRIALASSIAFLLGQLFDIHIFNKLRKKVWWFAPAVASIGASLLDTTLFFSAAFAGELVPWVSLGCGDFLVKLGMDLVLLLPFRVLLWGDGRFASNLIEKRS